MRSCNWVYLKFLALSQFGAMPSTQQLLPFGLSQISKPSSQYDPLTAALHRSAAPSTPSASTSTFASVSTPGETSESDVASTRDYIELQVVVVAVE